MAASQQQGKKIISTLSVRVLLLQQKMSDPANCMDGCDWVAIEDAVAMYKKGLTAGDFEHLKELALESNGDLAVTSELNNLEKVCFLDNIAIPAQSCIAETRPRSMLFIDSQLHIYKSKPD